MRQHRNHPTLWVAYPPERKPLVASTNLRRLINECPVGTRIRPFGIR